MSYTPQFLEKPLPSSESAERTILGAILLDGTLIAQAAESLKVEDFYSPLHRKVFEAMNELFKRSKIIDPITICEEMKTLGYNPEYIGGVPTVTNLTYGMPHFSEISEYVKIIKDKAQVRGLIGTCNQITSIALEEADEAEKVLDFAQSSINEICAETSAKGFETVGEVSLRSFHEKLALREKGVTFTGLATGFDAFDVTRIELATSALRTQRTTFLFYPKLL